MDPALNEVLNRSPVWRKLYETNERYRELWDAGKGPGQQPNELDYGPRYNHWVPLHLYAIKNANNWSPRKAKAFFRSWQKAIPNSATCNCKSNWKKLGLVPDYSSARAFFEWAWKAHNTVNCKLKKPTISLCDCYAIWWPERMTRRNG